MALSQSVLSELPDAFRAGDGVDLVRDAVRLVMQELIEVEAVEKIGAQHYERTDTRTTERNGSRPRLSYERFETGWKKWVNDGGVFRNPALRWHPRNGDWYL
jgi:transposase-like protein